MILALFALLALCLAASGLLSGSETGLYAVSRPRLRLRAAAGDRRAKSLESLLARPAGVLGALLIGNNAVNFLISAVTVETFAQYGWIHPDWWATAFLSPLLLVAAEMTPKDVAQRRADGWMLRAARPLNALRLLLAPVVAPIILLERLTGATREATLLSRGRLRAFMLQGVREGVLTEAQHELANRVMRFADLTVDLVAVPWHRVVTAPEGSDRDEVVAIASAHRLTRLPVVDNDGAVVGAVSMDQLVFEPTARAQALVQPLLTLAPDTRANDALRRLGAERQPLALIGTESEPIGLLALDDLVAALVGAHHPEPRRPQSSA
ncbi:MAG: CNNM domain-containing protein [Planctomycetota bacterium]